MPALGADMDEGMLNEWLVKPGDTVTRGQVVAVVETTKAAVEVECWHDGVVAELLVPVGQTVAVGTPLATLLEPGDQPAQPGGSAPDRPAAAPAPLGHRLWVSPVARRTAAALGVDLKTLTGTGPQGAITLHDVEHAAATAHHQTPAPPPPQPQPVATEPTSPPRKHVRAALPCEPPSPPR